MFVPANIIELILQEVASFDQMSHKESHRRHRSLLLNKEDAIASKKMYIGGWVSISFKSNSLKICGMGK